MSEPLLRVRGLTKHFPVTRGVFGRVVGQVRAVDDVSFDLAPGETLALVGESGCGKTTVGRLLLRLIEATAGGIDFEGRDIRSLSPNELRPLRRDMQIIFQDPYSSLNPRMRVLDIVGEALAVHGIAKGKEMEERVQKLLEKVGVAASWMHRYPHEFSGGQRQRIGIARALALNPKLIVCDEAVSALDVSIRAQVINLLIELQRELNLAYLFISHDLSIVKFISQRVAVMYLGQIVELAPTDALFSRPSHPYTRALLSAVPWPDPRRPVHSVALHGDVPSALRPPSGCRFHTRCPARMERCTTEEPPTFELEPGHQTHCWHAEGLESQADWWVQLERRFADAEKQLAARSSTPNTASERSSTPSTRAQASASPTTKPMPASSGVTSDVDLDADTDLDRWVARVIYVALLLAGATATLLGHPFWGFPIGLCGFVALLAPGQRFRLSAYRRFGLGLLAVILISFGVRQLERRRTAITQLESLQRELMAYVAKTGEPPVRLSELGFRLYAIFPDGNATDPWGNSWKYRPGVNPKQRFQLGSFGPDKKQGTDDIGTPPTAP